MKNHVHLTEIYDKGVPKLFGDSYTLCKEVERNSRKKLV
jgi:hypothetical protein